MKECQRILTSAKKYGDIYWYKTKKAFREADAQMYLNFLSRHGDYGVMEMAKHLLATFFQDDAANQEASSESLYTLAQSEP